jgi:hypothetical protein
MFREFYKDIDNKGMDLFLEKLKNRDMNEIDMDFPIAAFI